MDLQAILDATDSSSESEGGGPSALTPADLGSQYRDHRDEKNAYQQYGGNGHSIPARLHRHGGSRSSPARAMDLERILRESDEQVENSYVDYGYGHTISNGENHGNTDGESSLCSYTANNGAMAGMGDRSVSGTTISTRPHHFAFGGAGSGSGGGAGASSLSEGLYSSIRDCRKSKDYGGTSEEGPYEIGSSLLPNQSGNTSNSAAGTVSTGSTAEIAGGGGQFYENLVCCSAEAVEGAGNDGVRDGSKITGGKRQEKGNTRNLITSNHVNDMPQLNMGQYAGGDSTGAKPHLGGSTRAVLMDSMVHEDYVARPADRADINDRSVQGKDGSRRQHGAASRAFAAPGGHNPPMHHKVAPAPLRTSSSLTSSTPLPHHQSTSGVGGELAPSSAPGGEGVYGAHNAEDWAVLQQILSEADIDEDEDEEGLAGAMIVRADSDERVAAYRAGEGMPGYRSGSGVTAQSHGPDGSSSRKGPASDSFGASSSSRPPMHGLPLPPLPPSSHTISGQFSSSLAQPLPLARSHSALSSTSSTANLDVDAILQSIGSDDDDHLEEDEMSELDDIVARINASSAAVSTPLSDYTSGAGVAVGDSSVPNGRSEVKTQGVITRNVVQGEGAASGGIAKRPGSSRQDATIQEGKAGGALKPNTEPRRVGMEGGASASGSIAAKSTNSRPHAPYIPASAASASAISPDAVTAAALHHAASYERRLLRPGQRDIVSPLMVKRRMKPKIELQTSSRLKQQKQKEKQQQQLQQQAAGRNTFASSTDKGMADFSNKNQLQIQPQRHFDFAGLITIKVLPKISAELATNANLRVHTVGLPTALAVNSKFIAVGTQRGIVLVFDLFEGLRQQLGRNTVHSSSGQVGGGGPSVGSTTLSSSASPGAGVASVIGRASSTVDERDGTAKSGGSVTSIDLSPNGETLIAGYTSGIVVLWDIIKGIVLKSVTDAHPSPITSIRFISERDMTVVSVDAGGLVNRLTFSKVMLWSTYGVDTECLLDGTAGQILAMHVLPSISTVKLPHTPAGVSGGGSESSPHSNYHPSIKKLVLIALSSERSSFAVAVEPSVNVLHKWAKPTEERMGTASQGSSNDGNFDGSDMGEDGKVAPIGEKDCQQVFLPCLSWGWALVSGGGHVVTPILARAWGKALQLLQANFPPNDSNVNEDGGVMHWPAFGVHDDFDASAPVVALEWLGERSLMYLTVTNEFTVVDTVMMTLLERLDFSGVKLVYAEFSLSRTVASTAQRGKGKPDPSEDKKNEPCLSTTFQNSIRASDSRLLILCQEEIKAVSILGSKERITTLEEDGEWLEALALALDHYESTIKSQEDRKRNQDGTRDLSRHPEFTSMPNGLHVTEDEEWIADLLLRYLNLAAENAPDPAPLDQHEPADSFRSTTPGRIDLAQSHFQMLAGVCIEFCVVTRRLDLLFGPVFQRFQSVRYTTVFLDVLEPYVLNDKLHYIAPEAMAQFVEHCKATNDVATVERCLLHMDVTIMDFDSILSLLRKNGMYSALLHVFAHGLDDYITPFEILFEGIFDAADECDVFAERRRDGVPRNAFEQCGYKAVLYLQHCFEGKTFPQGQDIKPEERVDTLRPELLHFLQQGKYNPSASVSRSEGGKKASQARLKSESVGHRALSYPYMHVLLMVDAKAMLDVLSLALDAPGAKFCEEETEAAAEGVSLPEWEVEVCGEDGGTTVNRHHADSALGGGNGTDGSGSRTLCPDRQQLVHILSSIIMPQEEGSRNTASMSSPRLGNWRQSLAAKDAYLDFMAKYLLKGVVNAPKPITLSILSRMCSRAVMAKVSSVRRVVQDEIIALLEALPPNSYDSDEALDVVEKSHIHRAALLLHKAGVTALPGDGRSRDRRCHHFGRAIDSYLADEEMSFRREVFDFAKSECMDGSLTAISADRSEGTTERGMQDLLRDTLCKKLPDLVGLDPVLTAQLVAEIFIEDLDRILVSLETSGGGTIQFKFLHAIISGDLAKVDSVAGSVLNANLSIDHHQVYLTLMARLWPNMVYHHLSTHDNYRPEECLKLCQEYEIADASAYLLERMGNVSSALQLMLQTLEGRLMTLKRIVRGMGTAGYDHDRSARRRIGSRKSAEDGDLGTKAKKEKEIEGVKQILVVALDLCERNSGSSSTKSEHGSQLWFNVLDRLINAKGFLRLAKELPDHSAVMSSVLSELLQLTMQRMVSNVPLPDLVRKITTDHAGNRLGEFREMIVSMLKTYSCELDVCANAVEVMHQDVRKMSHEKRRLKLLGAKVTSLMGEPIGSLGRLDGSRALDMISNNSTLTVKKTGDANVACHGISVHAPSNRVHMIASLSRLQNRRARRDLDKKHRVEGRARTSLSMMTVLDQQFNVGDSPGGMHLGTRHIGILSDAEHYGRFG